MAVEALTEAEQDLEPNPAAGEAPEDQSAQSENVESAAANPGDVPEAGDVAVDKDALAMERLAAGENPKAVRQTLETLKPADSAPTANQTTTPVAPFNGFDGLDQKGYETLKRAGVALDKDDWNVLSQRGRTQQLTNARAILRERGRVSQQLGQRGTDAARAPAPRNASPGHTAGDDVTHGEHSAGDAGQDAPRYTLAEAQALLAQAQAGQRGVRAESTPARADDSQPVEEADPLQTIRDTYGDEFADSIATMFEGSTSKLAQYEQQLQSLSQQNEALAQAQLEPLELQAFTKLEESAGEIPDATRAEIKADAFALVQAAYNRGQRLPWPEAIARAGQGLLTLDMKRQAQAGLLENRNRSLRSTPTKAAGTPRGTTPLPKAEKDQVAMEALRAGKSAREVREMLSR